MLNSEQNSPILITSEKSEAIKLRTKHLKATPTAINDHWTSLYSLALKFFGIGFLLSRAMKTLISKIPVYNLSDS
jgi:hypothetical protein